MAAPKKPKLAEKKAKLLELLARGYGISEAVKIFGVSRQTYYRWSRNDPEFEADAKRILSDPAHKERVLVAAATTKIQPQESWQHTFARVYRTTGDRNEAADQAGVKPSLVVTALDRQHDNYDETFAALMADAEMRQMWRIEDAALRKAEHDAGMQKFVLSSRLKERYGSQGQAPTQQTNVFWFSADGESRAQNTMKELFGGGRSEIEVHSRPELDGVHPTTDS
jgi:hypothetical protein